MGRFKYSDAEQDLNKVLKMNQDIAHTLSTDAPLASARQSADANIAESEKLLRALGKVNEIAALEQSVQAPREDQRLVHRPVMEDWDDLVRQANENSPVTVELEDILTVDEINAAFEELHQIEQAFSKKTSIVNKTDLSFLAVATALQVAKSLLFPYIADKFHYGDSFDPAKRLAHNDETIEKAHRKANDSFRDEHLKTHGTGYWINLLYQTPPYDITRGSADAGINLGGAYHRLYTLGHDPILGWLFGTMNILTDTMTLNDLSSYRVSRNPMRIVGGNVPLWALFQQSYAEVKADPLNLPAALFAEAQHLKSDEYTKLGLPVPLVSSFNEDFASELYKSNYDALCFARDAKIVGASFAISKIFDLIILLAHLQFCEETEDKKLYEVRTRKILLVSNAIASTSTVINASITKNPKNLDIGSLLNLATRLFSDTRFILRIKQEYINSEISNRMQKELQEVDTLYQCI